MILKPEEVVNITGLHQAKRQARWFAQHGIKATINAANQCVVFVKDIEAPVIAPRPQLRLAK